MSDVLTLNNVTGVTHNSLKSIVAEIKRKYGKQILQEIIKQQAIKETKAEIDKNSFDYEAEKRDFFNALKSVNTKRVYLRAFSVMESYLSSNDLHILELKAKNIDKYIEYLNSLKLSNSTKRLYLHSISSFISKLVRYEHIEHNFIKGARLPENTRVRQMKIMTENDYNMIIESLDQEIRDSRKGKGSYKRTAEVKRKNRIVFQLLHDSGLRCGAVHTITIGQNGKLSYFSKGKAGSITVNQELASDLRTLDLSKISEQSIQKALQLQSRKARLKLIYNPHSLRHLFAVNFYTATKDIYQLKQLLNHSSISITERYLKSIDLL